VFYDAHLTVRFGMHTLPLLLYAAFVVPDQYLQMLTTVGARGGLARSYMPDAHANWL